MYAYRQIIVQLLLILMNTGKLNRRITIVTPGTMTPDGIGGFTEGAKTTRATWCSARQLSMGESLSYGLETATASFKFSFLYFAADDITRAKELTYEGRTFRIVNVDEVDENKHLITVIANERK